MLVKVSLLTFVPAFNREKTKRMEKETLTDREVLLLRRKLDLLLRTGKLLMESAADTNRIERNMKRVAAFMGIPEEKLHLVQRFVQIRENVNEIRKLTDPSGDTPKEDVMQRIAAIASDILEEL